MQGCNSWTSIQGNQQSREQSSFYGGMMPPDRAHIYELHVYALDTMFDLKPGFLLNELHHAMDRHILAMDTLKGRFDRL